MNHLQTENPAPCAFIVSETDGAPYRSRDAANVAAMTALLPGMILGALVVAGAVTAAAAADAGNAGNGTLTLDATTPVSTSVKDGVYRVVFDSATAFVVEDPAGKNIGKGAVGTAFAKELKFTVAAGGNAFAAGDAFSITVNMEAVADEQFVPFNPTATDGSQVVKAIACHRVVAQAGVVKTTIFNGPGEVRGSDLIWPAGITAPQKGDAIDALRKLGIKVR